MSTLNINGRKFTGWRADLIVLALIAMIIAPSVLFGVLIGMSLQ